MLLSTLRSNAANSEEMRRELLEPLRDCLRRPHIRQGVTAPVRLLEDAALDQSIDPPKIQERADRRQPLPRLRILRVPRECQHGHRPSVTDTSSMQHLAAPLGVSAGSPTAHGWLAEA